MRTEPELLTDCDAAASLAGYLLTAERSLMGLVLLGFGVSGVLNLVPDSSMPASAAAVGGALMQLGFAYPLLKGMEVLLELYIGRAKRKQRARAEVASAPRTRAAVRPWRTPRSGLRPALASARPRHSCSEGRSQVMAGT